MQVDDSQHRHRIAVSLGGEAFVGDQRMWLIGRYEVMAFPERWAAEWVKWSVVLRTEFVGSRDLELVSGQNLQRRKQVSYLPAGFPSSEIACARWDMPSSEWRRHAVRSAGASLQGGTIFPDTGNP